MSDVLAVRPADDGDRESVATVLAAAFEADPIMRWAFPDDAVRRIRLTAMWDMIGGEGYLPLGGSTVIHDAAAALWMPPGLALGEAFWAERGERFALALEGEVERIGSMGEAMAAHHPRERDHWYLMAIGVAPPAQGRSLGGALLAHTLAQADADGRPAYLEATSTRSAALYARFGFELLAQFDPAPGAPPMWAMWREPMPPALLPPGRSGQEGQ